MTNSSNCESGNCKSSSNDNSSVNSFKIKKPYYEASSEYAKVKFFIKKNGNLHIKAKFYDVSTISGIHIHTNFNGSSGPIIVWLGTTTQWQNGITQNTPLTNSTPSYNCAINNNSKKNSMATIIAPENTPHLKNLSNTTQYYKINKNVCPSCPWITDGTFLDIHGKNFQYLDGCKIVGTTPGIDMIDSIPFEKIE
jgi:hypothetical protein